MYFIVILLYFYNLVYSKENLLKNILIRTALLGFAPLFFFPIEEMSLSEGILECLLFLSPLPIFCLLSFIAKTSILQNKYFKHLFWICLYWFLCFVLFAFLKKFNLLEGGEAAKYFSFFFLVFISCLCLWSIIGFLLCLKFTKYDFLCLFWCFTTVIVHLPGDIIMLIPNEGDRLMIYYSSLFMYSAPLPLIIVFHHSFCFIKLFYLKIRGGNK